MKLRWWLLGWFVAVIAGVGLARWGAADSVFIPAAARPAPQAPVPASEPAPPVQAAMPAAPAT